MYLDHKMSVSNICANQGCRGNVNLWVFPYGNGMGMTLSLWVFLWVFGFFVGIPTEILWDWVLKFHSHGNPSGNRYYSHP